MLGFSALSEAPLGSVVAEAEAPLVYIGAIGAGQLGAYAIGASTSVAGEAPSGVNSTANANGVTVTASAPAATASVVINAEVNAQSNTITVTSPVVSATGEENAVASAASNTVTVSAGVYEATAQANVSVAAVTITVTPPVGQFSVGNTASADGVTVTLSAPVASLVANAEASPESPTVAVQVPAVNATGVASISVSDLQDISTTAPDATASVDITASADSTVVTLTPAEASATGQAAINYAELIDVGITAAEPTPNASSTIEVQDLLEYPVTITPPTALVNLGGFVIAEASLPTQTVLAPVISIEYGDLIGEPRVGAVYQTTTLNAYGDEVTVQLPPTVQNGGTLWNNGDGYWLNWDQRRVFILSSVGTGTLENINGSYRTTYPLHVLSIATDGSTTLLDTYASNLSTSITSNSDTTNFVMFSDTFRDGWAFFYRDTYIVSGGTRYVLNSVEYSQSEGFRHNGVNVTNGAPTGIGDVFGSTVTGSSYIYAGGPTGANWFIFRYRLPVGYTLRYRVIKAYKDASNETLGSFDTNTQSLNFLNEVRATYDASTIIAHADQVSYKYLNAFEAGSDTGRLQTIEQYDELRIQTMPEITVTPPDSAFPISVDTEVSTVFVSAPVASATGVTNIEGITVSVGTPDVQPVVTTEASSGIPAVLVTTPQTTFGVDYEANIDLPTVTVQTPTVYPSIVDFPDLPTIGIVRPQATATGITNANSLGFIVAITNPQVEATSRSTINVEVTTIPCTAPSVIASGDTNVVGFEIVVSTPEAIATGTANVSNTGFDIVVSTPEVVADVSYNAFATGVNIEVNSPEATVISTANISSAGFIIPITLPGVRALVNYRSPERTIIVPIEDRQIEVAFERRAIKVEFEDRVIEVT